MKTRYTLLYIGLLLVMLLIPSTLMAITKQNADDCYRKGNYQQAIIDYNDLLKHGVSADIYYNLGNAYFRSDNIAHAILSYERALRLAPGDEDIRFNLQFANSKTIDKITPTDDNVFETWYKSLVNFTSADNWAKTAICSIIFALLLMLAYLFASRLAVRKIGFYGGIVFLVVFILSNVFAWQQKSDYEHRSGAIIMVPSVGVKSSPVNKSADAFVLHEGTHVDVTDDEMSGWRAIKVADGREGWIKPSAIEMI